ncbi:hypothetical protein GWN42_31215 [candidate division KSB1 bacterium]|nr:YqaJ viral recombinase family protein [Phycisphaerae bacterium]NIQ92529.1 YqaJ viral recombinase family protein [Deltaproteobacteria bacterium]NIV97139.1 hypothetical protein [candidate division KSB1 bacterium]
MPESINISASRGAAILGLSKYRTPVEVWLEIMEQHKPGFCESNGFVKPERQYNAAMQYGHAFEDAIVGLYESETGLVVHDREIFYQHVDYIYITTHIDGYAGRNDTLDALHTGFSDNRLYEAKTANIRAWRESWGEPGTDEIPADYMVQVLHQMICTGYEEADIAVLILPENQDWLAENARDMSQIDPGSIARALADLGFFKIYTVKKNERLQSRMIEAYREFWETNILGENPPEPQKYDDIRRIVPAPSGTILANETLEALCGEYSQTNAALKAATDRKSELKKMIVNGMRKLSADAHEEPESVGKWRLLNSRGRQIASYSGDRFNVSKGA